MEHFLPLRLIDVNCSDGSVEPHLILSKDLTVEERNGARYAALSYCWGVSGNLITTCLNINERDIYGNAFFTIAAARALNVYQGMFQDRWLALESLCNRVPRPQMMTGSMLLHTTMADNC